MLYLSFKTNSLDGIAGGKNEGLLFKNGEILKKVPQDQLFETLIEEIKNFTR